MKIPLILLMSPEYCVAKINLLGCLVLIFIVRASFLLLNGMSDMVDNLVVFVSSLSLCINLSVIDLKLVSFELVVRYLFVSPLAIPLMVEGG